MRSKLFLMGMVFILCALLLNLGYSTGSVKAQEKHSLTVVLKPGVGFSAEGMDSVYGHIESVQNELLKLNFDGVMKETDPVAIANFFGDTGAMVKYDGTLAKGQKDIEDYLKEKKGHIEDMKIRLECIYVEELTHILNKPEKDGKDIVHIAFLSFSCAYKYDGESIDPPASRDDDHIRNCEWRY